MRIKPMHVEVKDFIKVQKARRRFLLFLINYLVLGGVPSLAAGCTPKITIKIAADQEMPMTFLVSRSQWWSRPRDLIRASVVKVSHIGGGTEPILVWHIEPARGVDPTRIGFSKLTLGVIPTGYKQLYPADTQPVFTEGDIYELVIIGDGLGVVRFRVKNGKITDLNIVLDVTSRSEEQ